MTIDTNILTKTVYISVISMFPFLFSACNLSIPTMKTNDKEYHFQLFCPFSLRHPIIFYYFAVRIINIYQNYEEKSKAFHPLRTGRMGT